MLAAGEILKDYISRTNIKELSEYPFSSEDLDSEINFAINCWSTEGFIEIWTESRVESFLIKELVCEGCGAKDTPENPLLDWMRFKFEARIMCQSCTSDDIDTTYRKIGFSEAEVKALRASREGKGE